MSKKSKVENAWEDTGKGALLAGSAGGAISLIKRRNKISPLDVGEKGKAIAKAYKKGAVPAALAGGYAAWALNRSRRAIENRGIREKRAGEDMNNKYLEKAAQIEKRAFKGLVGKVLNSKKVGDAVSKTVGAAGKAKEAVSKAVGSEAAGKAVNKVIANPGKAGLAAGGAAGLAAGAAVSGGKKNHEKKASSVTAVSALRRLAQKKKNNPILAKAFEKAHAKAKIYK